MSDVKLHIRIKFIKKYVAGKAPCSRVNMLDCDVFPLFRIQQGKLQRTKVCKVYVGGKRQHVQCFQCVKRRENFQCVRKGKLLRFETTLWNYNAAGKSPVCSCA